MGARSEGHDDLYMMNVDGSKRTRITRTPSGGYYQASFSPDGEWILFQGRPDNAETVERVYIVGADGTGMHQLTDSTVSSEAPRWSPDGKWIAFAQYRPAARLWDELKRGDVARAQLSSEIFKIRPDGSGLTRLTRNTVRDSKPRWSPDGKTIFFKSKRDSADAVYAINADGSNEHLVAGMTAKSMGNPSPDGRHAAYNAKVGDEYGIYIYEVATGIERLVIGGRTR